MRSSQTPSFGPQVSAYGSRGVRPITSSLVVSSQLVKASAKAIVTTTALPTTVCAASAPGLDTVVLGFIAVTKQLHPVRNLTDTGATESRVSEQYEERVHRV